MPALERSNDYARRVIHTLAPAAHADRILDDLHGCVVRLDGNPGGPKELTLTLTLSGDVAEAVLRAVAAPAPVETPEPHMVPLKGWGGGHSRVPASAPAPFTGLDMSDADPVHTVTPYVCPGCGSTASVHICPNAPEVVALTPRIPDRLADE